MIRFVFNDITLRLFSTKEDAIHSANFHSLFLINNFEIYFWNEANGYFYSHVSGLFDSYGEFSKFTSKEEKEQIFLKSTKFQKTHQNENLITSQEPMQEQIF